MRGNRVGPIRGNFAIRAMDERFDAGTEAAYNLELRSGTKTAKTRRFVEQVLSARYAANEFDDLADIGSWTLVPNEAPTEADLVRRFKVSRYEASHAISNLKAIHKLSGSMDRYLSPTYWVPFWGWENAPYLSKAKKEQLQALTRSFIKSVASWKKPDRRNRLRCARHLNYSIERHR